jgi:hypothetical protein
MGIWYCTREDVKSALDIQETARNNAQVDRAIEAASRSVEKLCHRKFYPWTGTRYLDWPNFDYASSGRLWLDGDAELISLTTFVSGGATVASSDYFLEPSDSGPPYDRIDIDRASSASLSSGDTAQRSVALTGVFGYDNVTTKVADLDGGINASVTSIVLNRTVGVGTLLVIGTERMLVTDRTFSTAGADLDVALTARASDDLVASSLLAAIPGEVIMIGSEKMLVVDVISGSGVLVKRAWDGSALATHDMNDTIYAARTLTVERGVVGTTAASHLDGDDAYRQVFQGPIVQLTIAEAISQIQQEGSGYAKTVSSGDSTRDLTGRGLGELRDRVYAQYARRGRTASV